MNKAEQAVREYLVSKGPTRFLPDKLYYIEHTGEVVDSIPFEDANTPAQYRFDYVMYERYELSAILAEAWVTP